MRVRLKERLIVLFLVMVLLVVSAALSLELLPLENSVILGGSQGGGGETAGSLLLGTSAGLLLVNAALHQLNSTIVQPIAGLRFYLVSESDPAAKPLALVTNQSGTISRPLLKGQYGLIVSQPGYQMNGTFQIFTGKLTRFDILVERAYSGVAQYDIRDYDSSSSIETWDTIAVKIDVSTRLAYNQTVFFETLPLLFVIPGVGSASSPYSVSVTGVPPANLSSIPAVVTGDYVTQSWQWVTLRPLARMPVGQYAYVGLLSYYSSYQVRYYG